MLMYTPGKSGSLSITEVDTNIENRKNKMSMSVE